MKKDLTELVFILDRSGSMQGLEEDTIGGFNSMLEKQKRETGEAFVSTILFDDRAEVLHDRIPIREVAPITGRDYWVRGCTGTAGCPWRGHPAHREHPQVRPERGHPGAHAVRHHH